MNALRASHEVRAPLDAASKTILAADSLPKWFKGASITAADSNWPSVGAKMAWQVGPSGRFGTFRAEVSENRLPEILVMKVATPSGESTITHRFERLANGNTKYEKTVEARYKGWTKMFGPLMSFIIERSMKDEVARAAALLDNG